MLKQPLFFAVALSLAASAAFAQERGAQFLDMVGALPADIVGNTADGFFTGGLLDFSDFRAGADALAQVPADNPGGFSPELQIYIRVTNAGLDPTSFQFGEQWQDLVGFAPADISRLLTISSPPNSFVAIELAGPAAIADTLLGNGYSLHQRSFGPAFGRGEDDNSIDIDAGNQADIFSGRIGQASRVAIAGNLVRNTSNWPLLDALMQGSDGTTPPAIGVLVAALDADIFMGTQLVQAMLLPPSLVPQLSENVDMPVLPVMPIWQLALLGDLSDGATDIAVLSFAYARRADAEQAATVILSLYNEAVLGFAPVTFAEMMPNFAAQTNVSGSGPYVVALSVHGPSTAAAGEDLRSRPFTRLLTALYTGDLGMFVGEAG